MIMATTTHLLRTTTTIPASSVSPGPISVVKMDVRISASSRAEHSRKKGGRIGRPFFMPSRSAVDPLKRSGVPTISDYNLQSDDTACSERVGSGKHPVHHRLSLTQIGEVVMAIFRMIGG